MIIDVKEQIWLPNQYICEYDLKFPWHLQKQICLPNREFRSDHRCEKIWLPNIKYLRLLFNTSYELVICIDVTGTEFGLGKR